MGQTVSSAPKAVGHGSRVTLRIKRTHCDNAVRTYDRNYPTTSKGETQRKTVSWDLPRRSSIGYNP